jgi:putative endonuclease
MTAARQRLGRIGEDVVARRLATRGVEILERNARVKALRGELDIVALDRGVLAFVEVKTLAPSSRRGPERPALAVGPRKQLQLRRLARAYLAERALPPYREVRFDVAGLRLDQRGRLVEWEYLSRAF